MSFFRSIQLIRMLDQGKILFKDLPFNSLNESAFVRIMRFHGHFFQQLPKRYKTRRTLDAAVLSRYDGIKYVGHENVTDELACKAIDRFGTSAFISMHDQNKTNTVALHAISDRAMAYRDIGYSKRTQEMAELAFSKNPYLISNFPREHITSAMLLTCLKKGVQLEWPAEICTQEIADYITEHRKDKAHMVPDRFLTPEVMARLISDNPEKIGIWNDALKCIAALRHSVDHMKGKTKVNPMWLYGIEGIIDRSQCIQAFLRSEHQTLGQNEKAGLYAILYHMNADLPEKMALLAEDVKVVPDVMAALYGTRAALKYFPKARNRGDWLGQELGL